MVEEILTSSLRQRKLEVRAAERERCTKIAKAHNENHADGYYNCGLAIAQEIEGATE